MGVSFYAKNKMAKHPEDVRHINKDMVGDGRYVVYPNLALGIEYRGSGKALSMHRARLIVRAFRIRNRSVHSKRGDTLWVIQEYCHLNNITIDIIEEMYGFVVKKV
jgi:hypothetical protein